MLLESLIFTVLFYFQQVEFINTASQQQWLKIYGSSTLEEFLWQRYILFEFVRRMPWVLTGLAILRFTEQFPILATLAEGSLVWRNIWYHLALSMVVASIYGLIVQNTLTILFRLETFPYYVYLRNFNGFFLSFIHYYLLVTVVSMVNYHRKFKHEELRAAKLETTTAQLETELAQAQLHALKMQLQPHFLFNALNSISALLYNNPRRADTMIARLGDFLRMTLDNPTTQFISLKQELDLLKCYVDIEMMRFPSRLHVEFRIDDGLLDAEVPNLLLQPLVENSVKYGILQSTDGGNIIICARPSPTLATMLELTVRDNGPGIQPTEAHKNLPWGGSGTFHKKSSIGLQNTRERLQKLYGEQFRFDTYNAPAGGFVVYIEIPLRTHKTSSPQEHQNPLNTAHNLISSNQKPTTTN